MSGEAGRFFGFAAVGAAGFAVDAAALLLLKPWLGPYAGRALSWLVAASATFALNRSFVFRDQAAPGGWAREWLRFLGANVVGGGINYGVYAALVASGAPIISNPFAALAAGSVAGLFANFTLTRRLVFRRKSG